MTTSLRPRQAFVALVLVGTLAGCKYFAREATIAYMQVNSALSSKTIEIEINKDFLDRYRNRVSIDAHFTVDESMQNPVAKAFDGDLHLAGRAPEIQLPAVVEIANAAARKDAIAAVHLADSTKVPLVVSGVWRIWPEHAGNDDEDQGKPIGPLKSATPDHVFEIHPVTHLNGLDLRDTFRPVTGFAPGDAATTFAIYQKVECKLRIKPNSVSIVTEKGVYNDAEFMFELLDDNQMQVTGGRIMKASVLDLNGKLLVDTVRMVFATGTAPEIAVRQLRKGGRMHVFGMPRVDFNQVWYRVKNYQRDPKLLGLPLPYEMIVIGMYEKK